MDGILFHAAGSSGSNLNKCTLEHAQGYNSSYDDVIHLYSSLPSITGGTINNSSADNGIYCQNSSPEITNNTITGFVGSGIRVIGPLSMPVVFDNTIMANDIGIQSWSDAGFYRGNTISGNTSYGIINQNTTANMPVDAEYNYWGDNTNTGPYDPSDDTSSGGWFNPSGLGDEVSDKVDYAPWVGSNYDIDGDAIPDLWETDNFLDTTVVDENSDDDSDGLWDIYEFAYGANPKVQDTDNDGMPDGYESDNKFNPTKDDAREDADEDSFSNLREYISDTGPRDDQDIPSIIANDDADNDVDGYNLAMLIAEFGRYDCGTFACDYDLDSDGNVDEVDLYLFSGKDLPL